MASTRHMKMKLPDLSGTVIVIKSDQEEARKCYENSMKTKRSVFTLFKCPPYADTAMEIEPLNEAMPTESTPGEATPVKATPQADTGMVIEHLGEATPARATPEGGARTEERPNGISPVEKSPPGKRYKATLLKEGSRDRSAANVVERQIGGKTFKLGRLLSREEQDEVVEVISRHLDAFAWSASARIRQATWSFEGSLLKGLDFKALVSLTQYSGKPSRAEGTRSEQQTLKNLPFHPVKEFWKGVRRTLPGTLLRVTHRLFLCFFTSKK